ncbi:F-box domain, FBD domain, Leucine-rich repeat domain, L domain-like protein [Artemisia annua]|uniref:F-box domain, FBD domain, Leucine-rich repeat domain, L domain-like protein n=1 Tax=Artemisia annua TaxID=35608 RepID=A0A2U1KBH1_ARTAN|nr:F-box domain, FBD domain, Leucine-rich repeat domain, L domain-like protein [Artemisia annua]
MKKLKRSKARIRDNKVDHISNLPDPILHLILSRLHSTEEVVRNSILSKRWKYLWTSVPSLNIDFTRKVKDAYTAVFHRNEFKEFVDRVLANRTLDLDSFTLNCLIRYDMSTIGHWIDLAVMRKVKQLDLDFRVVMDDDWNDIVVLPRWLVDCGSLEALKLYLFQCSLSFESFTGSRTLKSFKLDNVVLLDYSTYNLDYLDISCLKLKSLRIDNRGLNYLDIVDCLCKTLSSYAQNLCIWSIEEAVIELEDLGDILVLDDNFGVTLRELFAQVSHVEYLSIHRHSIKSIAFNDFPEEVFPSLPNLKTLEIALFCCDMDYLVCLLKCSPNLESLYMIIIDAHGIALEEMVFSWSNKDKYHTQSMDTMNEVSNFYKASLSVKVITLLKIDTSDSSETDTSCSSESDTSF